MTTARSKMKTIYASAFVLAGGFGAAITVTTSCGGIATFGVDAAVDSATDTLSDVADEFDAPAVQFACGDAGLTCASTTEMCDTVRWESTPNTYYCDKLGGCHSCSCLADAGWPGLACYGVDAPKCTDDGGIIVLIHGC